MEATLLTLKFDARRGDFEKERIEDFCMNKKIHSVEGHFFQHEDIPYWTVMIRFDRVLEKDSGIEGLSVEEREAFEKLKAWRKERAEKEGFPPYLIATNKQLVRMIAKSPTTSTNLSPRPTSGEPGSLALTRYKLEAADISFLLVKKISDRSREYVRL